MNNENFRCEEYQKNSEFQSFKAEQYKTKSINTTAPENYHSSEYFTNTIIKDKNKENNIFKRVIQNVTESASTLTGSIAATATVLAATVVAMTTLITTPPTIEILDLETYNDKVAYNILLEDIDEEIDYYVNISNNIVDYEYELFEGENINTIENMPDGYAYKLKVLGKSDTDTVTYLTEDFYIIVNDIETYKVVFKSEGEILEETEYNVDEIPKYTGNIPIKKASSVSDYKFIGWDKTIEPVSKDIEYNAVFEEVNHYFKDSINVFNSDDFIVNWDEDGYYNISINTGFTNDSDDRVFYELSLYNNEEGIEEIYRGTDQIANIKVTNQVELLNIKYKIIGLFDEVEVVIDEKVLMNDFNEEDLLVFAAPQVYINETLNYVSENTYSINLEVNSDYIEESIKSIDINLDYIYDDDSTKTNQKTLNMTNKNVNELLEFTFTIPYNVKSVVSNCTIVINSRYGNNERVITYQENSLVPTLLEVTDIVSNNYNGKEILKLSGKYSLRENQVIVVENTSTNEIYTNTQLPFEVLLVEGSEYKYYIGTLNTDNLTYTELTTPEIVNIQSGITGDYNFNYQNVGDTLKTFNDDGTVNIYINTEFESIDEDIYWDPMLYTSYYDEELESFMSIELHNDTQESIASIENIPNESYGLTYYVYKIVDNIKYVLKEVSVSGSYADECYFSTSVNVDPDNDLLYTITCDFNTSILYDINSIYFVITDKDGNLNKIELTDENSIYDSENKLSYVTIQGDNGFTSGSLFIDCSCYATDTQGNNSYETLSKIMDIKGSMYFTYEFKF